MKRFWWLLAGLWISQLSFSGSIYDLKTKTLQGKNLDFAKFKDKVIVIANTASRCGYTDQYGSLEKLYQKYKAKGLVVVGFPSNSFKQELKDDQKIAKFCKLNYGVSFPLTQKTMVTGKGANPIFKYLVKNAPKDKKEKDVAWNFEKFIVDRKGLVKYRFRSSVDPLSKDFIKAIDAVL